MGEVQGEVFGGIGEKGDGVLIVWLLLFMMMMMMVVVMVMVSMVVGVHFFLVFCVVFGGGELCCGKAWVMEELNHRADLWRL